MKTLLIRGAAPVPEALREIVSRGSTSLQERRAADLAPPQAAIPVDRVVFWASRYDAEVYALAQEYSRVESKERRETIVFVAADGAPAPERLAATEVFCWPRDEDRLTMAFLTGA